MHDLHNDFPFCPESKIPPNAKHPKLLLDFSNKKNYIIHYLNLQQIVRNGLKITKVHKMLKFSQSKWLKPYIELNNQKRTEAKTSFEKDFYKLMNNVIFGKSVEAKENHKVVHLVTQWKASGKKISAEKLIAKPTFQSISVFDDEFAAIEMMPVKVKLNRPTYVGFTVLENSKHIMYEFMYSYLLPKFGDKFKLCYVDTDAFLFQVKVDDFMGEIRNDVEKYFDTSDVADETLKKHNIKKCNKKVLGKFKDECNGYPLVHFVGLKPKCYAIEIQDKDTNVIKTRLKGVSKSVVRNYDLQPYIQTLHSGEPYISNMTRIQSKLHNLKTVKEQKIAITNIDDKRFQIPGTYNTLAWHHKDIAMKYNVHV